MASIFDFAIDFRISLTKLQRKCAACYTVCSSNQNKGGVKTAIDCDVLAMVAIVDTPAVVTAFSQ